MDIRYVWSTEEHLHNWAPSRYNFGPPPSEILLVSASSAPCCHVFLPRCTEYSVLRT